MQAAGQAKTELTDAAKLLIQRYMLKLLALPVILTGAISFAGGYFIDKGAKDSAYTAAYQEAIGFAAKSSGDAVEKAGAARAAAEQAKTDAEKSRDDAKAASDLANTIMALKLTREEVKQFGELVRDAEEMKSRFIEAILADEKFKQKVVKAMTGGTLTLDELRVQEILVVSKKGEKVGRISSGKTQLSLLNQAGQPAAANEFVFELCTNRDGGGNFTARHPRPNKSPVGAEIAAAPDHVDMTLVRSTGERVNESQHWQPWTEKK